MNKFKWGGFDKYDLFVTSSFLPSYYAHKTLFERAAFDLIGKGERERAVELVDKYFSSFPHKNFPYDARILNLLRIYEQALNYDKAKEHMQILANETEEYLRFYRSLSPSALQAGFSEDQKSALTVVRELKRMATTANDTEYLNELNQRFSIYEVSGIQN